MKDPKSCDLHVTSCNTHLPTGRVQRSAVGRAELNALAYLSILMNELHLGLVQDTGERLKRPLSSNTDHITCRIVLSKGKDDVKVFKLSEKIIAIHSGIHLEHHVIPSFQRVLPIITVSSRFSSLSWTSSSLPQFNPSSN